MPEKQFYVVISSVTSYLLIPRSAGPLRASGDENSPSVSVAGDPAGSIPAASNLFQVFCESSSPCLLRPDLFLPPSSGTKYIAVLWGFSLQSEDVTSHFPSCNNVLDSLHVCPPRHLFICRAMRCEDCA